MAEKKKSTVKREKPIPTKKLNSSKELSDLSKNKRTILLASIKNLPASQFQEISKKLRGKAIVKVPKKNIAIRAFNSVKEDKMKELNMQIIEDVAILFSDMEGFELAGELMSARSPAKAKKGQIAPENIEVEKGPTDLLPGPAVSELGALGIPIMIDKGKIAIKENKLIVKKGEAISQAAADVMGKLDIKPFTAGFEPLVIYDTIEKKIYVNIKINKEETLNELKYAFGKSLPFALEIGYVCEDTIKLMIVKAGREELALLSLSNTPEVKSDGEAN
ncbi:50S ribosomal protein L10 [Candidatus Pacearchaeota archaeon CG10_big_fil_rev_8_21_14_0_10_32_14]|nr:MAG: 50S ribosomal protein L10 [Candidatus Pacearchaeota archaeon CG10_big_fil_rev_8_21_14_0_10_32_14]